MDKEYSTTHQMGDYPKSIIVLILAFFPLLGIFLSISAICVSYSIYTFDGYPLIYSIVLFTCLMLISAICSFVGWAFISRGLAKYRFTDIGLIAKFPLRKEVIIPWESFQQVCVCYAAYTTMGKPRANTVICCVKRGETKSGIGRWKTDNPFRYRSVICIDYSEALFNGLVDKYPGTVVDLRNSPEYRLK